MSGSYVQNKLKPLNGSPMISDNCWSAVLGEFHRVWQSGQTVRYLEWGAGNSTVSVLREAVRGDHPIELTSVEHASPFIPWLASSLIGELPKGPLTVEWRPLKPPMLKTGDLGGYLKDRRALSARLLTWQQLSGNKRLQPVDKYIPDFSLSVVRLLKQSAKVVAVELAFWRSLALSLIRGLGASASQSHPLAEAIPISLVDPHSFQDTGLALAPLAENGGCLTLKSGKVIVHLWHLPALMPLVSRIGVFLDGQWSQFARYVSLPLKGQFDVVFIDGRARVSCIKRVARDRLLRPEGVLFVHDAFRAEMTEGFLKFGKDFSFLNGSNITTAGEVRCAADFGPPLMWNGDSQKNLRHTLVQEMFLFRNKESAGQERR